MPVDAVFLLVAHPILLNKFADWHLVDVILVQKVAFVATFAGISEPMDADLLFALFIADFVLMREHMGLHFIVAHLLVYFSNKSARLGLLHVLRELASSGLGLLELICSVDAILISWISICKFT